MMSNVIASALKMFVLVSVGTGLGCGESNKTPDMATPAGTEGGPCYPNKTCNDGLTCASSICVRLPDGGMPPDGAPVDASSPDTYKPDTQTGDISATDSATETAPPDADVVTDTSIETAPPDGNVVTDASPDAKQCATNADCDDGLTCTTDICGVGGCAYVINSNFCVVDGACVVSGTANPSNECQKCLPLIDQSTWSNVDGIVCDDGVDCTHTDTCSGGSCAGTVYVCDDGLTCTTDSCTGTGPAPKGCAFKLQAGNCLIAGTCYAENETSPANLCLKCLPTINTTNWTWADPVDHCQIDGACYAPGQKNTGGCAECDPTKDKYGWTPVGDKCFIHGLCFADQAKDSSGCLYCSAGNDSTHWTPLSGVGLKAYDFESGTLSGWTVVNSDPIVGWQVVSNRRSVGGSYALYYGNPVTGDFDNGSTNSGSATMPSVALPAGKKAGLAFALYMDTESNSTFDKLIVKVNSTTVWQKAVGSATVTMKTWQLVTLDLSSYAGQTVTVKFEFDSVDGFLNSGEGVFIDDLYLHYGC